jgi:hypothetical protein
MADLTTESVKDRIETQVLADLRDALNLPDKDVQAFDPRHGNHMVADGAGNPPDYWLVVTFGEEDQAGPGDGAAIQTDELTLPVTIDGHLQGLPAGMSWHTFGNRVIALLKQAFMANFHREEGGAGSGGVELAAIGSRITGTFNLPPEDEQREAVAGIEGEIIYRHQLDDPYTVA